MRAVAIIPARGGSKRVPRKNVRPLAGRSLVARAIDSSLAVLGAGHVYVSTEDAEIAAEATARGALVIERPAALATDDATAWDVLTHALGVIGEWDAWLLLNPTSPFRSPALIRRAVDHLAAGEPVVTVRELSTTPYCTRLAERQRTQDMHVSYVEAGGLWGRCALDESEGPRAIVVDAIEALDIDTEDDWLIADAVALVVR
jgi:N-acylneuraminate cytidylyltransferase